MAWFQEIYCIAFFDLFQKHHFDNYVEQYSQGFPFGQNRHLPFSTTMRQRCYLNVQVKWHGMY